VSIFFTVYGLSCVCKAGFGEETCIACTAGKYKGVTGSVSCTVCHSSFSLESVVTRHYGGKERGNLEISPTHEPVKPLISFDSSVDDLHTNHKENHCTHIPEKVQLKPGLVHIG
jgi:hypothetical protein